MQFFFYSKIGCEMAKRRCGPWFWVAFILFVSKRDCRCWKSGAVCLL